MSSEQDENYYKSIDLRGCLNWTFKIMTYGGYWLPKRSTKITNLLGLIYMIWIVSLMTVTPLLTEGSYLIFKARDLEDLVDSSFLLLTHASQSVKLIFIMIGRDKIKRLLSQLDEDVFKPKNIRQFESSKRIIKYTNIFGIVLVLIVTFTIIFIGAVPATEKGEYQLPIKALFPSHIVENYYEILYIYQVFTICVVAYTNTAVDISAAAFMSEVCIQLEILSDNIIHIKDIAEEQLKKKNPKYQTIVPNKNIEQFSEELESEMYYTLINCVRHHLKILNYAKDVQWVFSVPIFFQLFIAVGTMCMTLFQMSMVDALFSVRLGSYVLYICCMLIEISVFCWYGNDITVKSEKLASSVYDTDWVECSKQYKNLVHFLMVHMQQILRMRVGNLVDLSLENLVLVYRTSWSYFLVLNRMH